MAFLLLAGTAGVRAQQCDVPQIGAQVFVEPGGSHLARIGTMSEDQKQKVMSLLRGWLEE